MKDPMVAPDADDPRLVWIAYSEVAAPDRFVIPDDANDCVYMYVPLDAACRWVTSPQKDDRTLLLHFHPNPVDDARLARIRTRYLERAARAIDLWDHTPRAHKS